MPPYFLSGLGVGVPDSITTNLDAIHCNLIAHELYNVLKKRVKRAKKRSVQSKCDGTRLSLRLFRHKSEVHDIVSNMTTKMSDIKPPDVMNERHLESFQEQNKCLKETLGLLKKVEVLVHI
jgi:hypothetical protein